LRFSFLAFSALISSIICSSSGPSDLLVAPAPKLIPPLLTRSKLLVQAGVEVTDADVVVGFPQGPSSRLVLGLPVRAFEGRAYLDQVYLTDLVGPVPSGLYSFRQRVTE
jgi:hypothetical protein